MNEDNYTATIITEYGTVSMNGPSSETVAGQSLRMARDLERDRDATLMNQMNQLSVGWSP